MSNHTGILCAYFPGLGLFFFFKASGGGVSRDRNKT